MIQRFCTSMLASALGAAAVAQAPAPAARGGAIRPP